MKGPLRWLTVISATLALLLTAHAPVAQAAYFNNDIWEAINAVESRLFSCGDDYRADKPISVTESEVGFGPAQRVGTDEAINFFSAEWAARPGFAQDGIDSLKARIKKLEDMGYDTSYERECLRLKQTYGLPNVINAVPVAQRTVVSYYATISVSGDQVAVTPKFDRVTVVSATIQNGSPVVTIQVTNQTTGYLDTYTSSYPAIVPPGTPDEPPATPHSFTKVYTPTISGSAKVGKALTAKVKTWSPKASMKYQWLRNGSPITGATKSTYKLVAADLGAAISVKVTGSKSGYTSVSKTSSATKTVKAGSLAKGKVSVSGTRRVGRTLTAKTSKWSSGVEYHYQWYRNSTKITDANGRTYTLTPSDRGKRVKVKVWTTKDGYNTSKSKTSARTAKVRYGYLTKVTPVITGTAVVGEVLTATSGTWKPNTTTFTYQWYKVNAKGKSYRIAGATSSTFTVSTGLVGYRLTVKVTGKSPGYYTASKTSARTAKVSSPTPTPTAAPTPSPSTPTPEPTPTTTP